MHFVMFMVPAAYAEPDPDVMPSAEAVERMMDFNAELDAAGVLLARDRLHPPAVRVRSTFGGDRPSPAPVTGPGVVGGDRIVEVARHDEALQWARSIPATPGDAIDVRRTQQAEDFPNDVQDVLKTYNP